MYFVLGTTHAMETEALPRKCPEGNGLGAKKGHRTQRNGVSLANTGECSKQRPDTLFLPPLFAVNRSFWEDGTLAMELQVQLGGQEMTQFEAET